MVFVHFIKDRLYFMIVVMIVDMIAPFRVMIFVHNAFQIFSAFPLR